MEYRSPTGGAQPEPIKRTAERLLEITSNQQTEGYEPKAVEDSLSHRAHLRAYICEHGWFESFPHKKNANIYANRLEESGL